MSLFHKNMTHGLQYRTLLELVLAIVPITLPCCVFIIINIFMLFTLRSKRVFRETCRHILLFNLIFADTIQLTLGQLMYIMSFTVMLAYPLCCFLIVLNVLATQISPLTLVVMSLERYVAVCYPLRHSTLVTSRNTVVAIIVIWVFSSSHAVIRLVLLSDSLFENPETLQMTTRCSTQALFFNPVSQQYNKVYTYFLFVSSGVAIISSFIGVTIAATSASTDKASARKAHKTLLLHLVQLGLTLISTMYNLVFTAVSIVLDGVLSLSVHIVLYVVVVMLPRCLSALIYGIRDNTIRPILMYYLCCQKTSSVNLKPVEFST